MPIELEFQPLHGGRWRSLSHATTHHHSMQQLFGWAMVLGSGSWRTNEVEMTDIDKLVSSLRKRQAIQDAPAVLDELEEKGILAWLDGDTIRIKGDLTDEIRQKVKNCKPALIALLKDVPEWSDAEAAELEQKVKDAHQMLYPYLHPTKGSFNDDCFAEAARSVCADVLGSIARAKAIRRIDHVRRRVDWCLAWMQTLDARIIDLRDSRSKEWERNRKTLNYKDFQGHKVKQCD